MCVYIASLNSGSNGNCYYVGNNDAAVLIDAGISCRETAKRMKRLGLGIDKVRAIFITHEHTDHINGLLQLSKQYQLPVYITPATLKHCYLELDDTLIIPFTANQPVTLGGLTVTPFTKHHDADDPHSFIVESNNITIGIFTDIGFCCANVVKYFKKCHAAFLEANYDEHMLATGGYPYHLKKRISGGNGHLSNTQALDLFVSHAPAFMGHLILSHLSKNNNKPQIVQQLFNQHAGGTKIVVASRDEETPVFTITGMHRQANRPTKTFIKTRPAVQQLTLFG